LSTHTHTHAHYPTGMYINYAYRMIHTVVGTVILSDTLHRYTA